jgi:deoxyribose-phosphate aldolase
MIREIKLLTRQRNEAQERVNRQELDFIKLSNGNQKLQSDVNELNGLVEYLQDRIKKLKKAGDDLAKTQTHDLLETINWFKAKEAKL